MTLIELLLEIIHRPDIVYGGMYEQGLGNIAINDIPKSKSVVRVVKGERYHKQEDVHIMCTKNDEVFHFQKW